MATMPDDHGPVVFAVTVAMITLSTAFTGLRLISRCLIVRRVTLDDYLIVVAWVIAFGLSFSVSYAVKFGLGRHQTSVSPPQEAILQRLEYTFSVLYNPALVATKSSILVFYLSLVKTYRVFKYCTLGTLVVVIVAGFALTLLNVFQCRHLDALFDFPRPQAAACTDIITLYLSSAPLNISTDLAILVIPMPILRTLKLPRKQKIILYLTFSVGAFVAVVDILRIAALQEATTLRLEEIEADTAGSSTEKEALDFAYYASYTFMWSVVEVNVGMMCASVPALKPLVSRFLPRLLRDQGEITPPQQHASMATPEITEVKSDAPPLDDQDLSFTDFLTTPDMNEMPHMQRTDTAATNTSAWSPPNSRGRMFYDFVDFAEQKLVNMTNKESVRPLAVVTVLFFLWGFAYGLLSALNGQFQIIARMTAGQSIALHSAYFCGYIVGPPTLGRITLKKAGFKACYIVGLVIWAVGCLAFWPSAVLTSFPAFWISTFIVGFGLSLLEVAANPFIALCGPPEYAEVRLNLSQAVQGIGGIVSPLLAKKVLFRNVVHATSLQSSQWTYLAIALFACLLAYIYYLIKLPEATDEELEKAAAETFNSSSAQCPSLIRLRETRIAWITLAVATFTQLIYVGCQESVSVMTGGYLSVVQPSADSVYVGAVAHTFFAGTRAFAAVLGILMVKPRHILLFFLTIAVVFSILSMQAFPGIKGIAMLMVVYAAEGPLFSIIFAQGLRGQGRHTKDASVLLTAAIGGGAIFPPIIQAVASSHNAAYAYAVPIALFAVCMLMPIYLEAVPLAKKQTDPLTGVLHPAFTREALHSLTLRHRKPHPEAAAKNAAPTRSLPPRSPSPQFITMPDSIDHNMADYRAHDFAFNTDGDTPIKERISSSSGATDTPLLRAMRRLSTFLSRQTSRVDSVVESEESPMEEIRQSR